MGDAGGCGGCMWALGDGMGYAGDAGDSELSDSRLTKKGIGYANM